MREAPEIRGPTIAIATDESAAHLIDICAGLAARGATGVAFKLADCGFDGAAPHGLRIPGFDLDLPDAVFVRALAGGSFEAVTKRLGVLHALAALGVPVINSAKAMENCVDKSMTSFLLAQAGVPTPQAYAVETRGAAAAIVARAPGPLVLKPLFGSQGRGLVLVRQVADLPEPAVVNGVYYLQHFVPVAGPGYRDHRLLVWQGRILAAMTRQCADWIVNIKQGGQALAFAPPPEMCALALQAAQAVGAVFAGVDIIVGVDGVAQVIEVNSTPAWTGLQSVTDFDVAGVVAGELLAMLGTAACDQAQDCNPSPRAPRDPLPLGEGGRTS